MRWLLLALICFVAGALTPGLGTLWPSAQPVAYAVGLALALVLAPILSVVGIVAKWRSWRSEQR